jgi:signal transduction histidine kinase
MNSVPLLSESGQENISAIEWLSTSIVHDLRNPLGTIYAAAEMLMDLDLGPTQVKRLSTISIAQPVACGNYWQTSTVLPVETD